MKISLLRHVAGAIAVLGIASVLTGGSQATAASNDRPGDFDYYALVLSWSPSFCLGKDGADDPQCDRKRAYAFVLHGLWPQYRKGYPQECRIGRKPWVSKRTIDSMLDIMPSPRLVIHEYKKHGTCSGLDPESYFALSRKLTNSIVIPERYRASTRTIETSVADLEADFLAANPKLKADMIAISCGKPNRLRDIRICFDLDGDPRSCGANEDQSRLCRNKQISLPPVRGGGGAATGDDDGGSADEPI